jgi:WD40 repeat protein
MASKGVKTIDDGEVSKMDEGDNYANLAVSPDGTLVFAEATGSDPGFMTSVYGSDGVKKWVSEPLEFPSLAAWDPKGGDRIVFGGETATAGGSMAGSVLVWDAGQGQVTELTQLEQGRIATAFAWSPDGTSLACAAIRSETGTTDLWTMNADGSGAKLLLKDAAAPSWALSPIDLSAGAAPSTAESASP